MPSANYGSLQSFSLTFSNIMVTETDIGPAGSVDSFILNNPIIKSDIDAYSFQGIEFAAFASGVSGPNTSQVVTFNYTVTAGGGHLIDGLDASYTIDAFSGPNPTANNVFNVVEQAFDTSGHLLATQVITAANTSPGPVYFTQAQSAINVVITMTEAIGPGGSDGSTGDVASQVDISDLTQNFGVIDANQVGSIGDIVFLDTAGTGLESGFDAGPGVANVTVELLDATGTTTLATTTTDANGLYSFNNLLAGTYEVKFDLPTGYTFTQQGVGSDASINSSADQVTGITGPIVVVAGQANHNVEAGLLQPTTGGGGNNNAAIGDYVWLDANGNGIQDGTEQGVANVSVDLMSAGIDGIFGTGDDIVLQSTSTDGTGHYAFTGLAAGQYEVQFFAPGGDAFTAAGKGSDANLDSNADATGRSGVITLSIGQTDNSIDAGVFAPASFTAHVYNDANKSNGQDGGESNLSGITVNLLDGSGNPTGVFGLTDSNGNVTFSGLAPGSYEVSIVAPAGDTVTQHTNVLTPVTLASGQTANAIEGLYAPTGTPSLKIVKTEDVSCVDHTGQVIHYTITVTNTGSSTLTGVNMSDPNGSHLTFVAASDTNHNGKLDVGETWTWTADHTVTQSDIDAGVLTASTSGCGSVSYGGCGSSYSSGGSSLSCFGSYSGGSYGYGSSGCGVISSGCGTGGSGGSSGGNIVNIATVTTDQTGPQSAMVAATALKEAALKFTKTEDLSVVNHAGQVIHYTITAQNTGNATLTGVTLTDPNGSHLTFVASSDTNHNGKLDVGETWTWTADHTVTQAEIDAASNISSSAHGTSCDSSSIDCSSGISPYGSIGYGGCGYGSSGYGGISYGSCGTSGGDIVNTATIDTNETGSTSATVDALIDKNAALKILKTEDISSVTKVGQVIHYTITVQNTGNATLTGVKMSDPNGQHLTFVAASDTNHNGKLDVGETWSWTADHTVTAAELAYGKTDDTLSFRSAHIGQVWGDSNNAGSTCISNASDSSGDCSSDLSSNTCGGSGTGYIVNVATVTTDETKAASASVSAVIVKAPTGKLCDDYGKASEVEFCYKPGDTCSSGIISSGLGSCSGHNSASMCFIEISNKANAFDKTGDIFYKGTVSSGACITADASVDLNKLSGESGLSCFDTTSGTLYVHIFKDLATFNAHGSSMQELSYDVSGGHGGDHLNDQIGSLCLVGYQGTTGHGGYWS